MSRRSQLYRNTFRALHGRNERLLTKGIVRGIRKDLSDLPPLQVDTYESYLKGLEFKNLEQELFNGWIRSGQIGTFVYDEIEGLRSKRVNPFFSEIWRQMVFNNSKLWIGANIVSIKGTLLEDIKKLVSNAVLDAVVLPQIATLIEKTVNQSGFYRWQALRIARTETTSAMNSAMETAGEESNLVMNKLWISAGDGNERETHATLDGSVVAMNGTFDNGLQYPGDPSGLPEEIINCRCTFAYEPVRDGNGELIIK